MASTNLKDLAKQLNLSASTVSRALRGSHEISKETTDRVRELANRLGYRPNPHASSLRQSRSSTIAVILPEIENNFFSQVMNGVEEVGRKKDYHVLIYLTHEDRQRERDILQVLRNGRVDGIMISVASSNHDYVHLEQFRDSGLPLIFFDRVVDGFEVPRVSTDDADASFRGTEHLIARGAKRIAFLSLSDELSIMSRRKDGFMRALREHGLEEQGLTLQCGQHDEVNRRRIRELLTSERPPDAVFCSVEKLAINTYEVCFELGRRIPDQLKVIGFSNQSASALFNPSLTAIVQPAYEIGKEAAALLFKLIGKKTLVPGEDRAIFPSKVVERASTGGRPGVR